MHITGHYFQFQITGYRIRYSGSIGRKVLISAADYAVTPNNNAFAFTADFVCLNRNGSLWNCCAANGQFIAVYFKLHSAYIAGKLIISKYAVFIFQRSGVICTVPFQLESIRITGASGEETRQLGMLFDFLFHISVMSKNLIVQRVRRQDIVLNIVFALSRCIYLVELTVTLANYSLPDQQLRCNIM